jgi:hypothetical protein
MMRKLVLYALIAWLAAVPGPVAADPPGEDEAASQPSEDAGTNQPDERSAEMGPRSIALEFFMLEPSIGGQDGGWCEDSFLSHTPLCSQCEGQSPENQYGNTPIFVSESGVYIGGPATGNPGSHDGLFGPYEQIVNLDPNGCD